MSDSPIKSSSVSPFISVQEVQLSVAKHRSFGTLVRYAEKANKKKRQRLGVLAPQIPTDNPALLVEYDWSDETDLSATSRAKAQESANSIARSHGVNPSEKHTFRSKIAEQG